MTDNADTPAKPLQASSDDDAQSLSSPSAEPGEQQAQYLPMGPKLIGILISLMLGVFCMALDNTIIAVAIPKITDEFHALNDVGWYASAYLLTGCSFQLFFGKLYSLLNIKWIFLGALFIFEVGSLICAVAPSSTVLIVGRAIAGLGSAGIFSGALMSIASIAPLDKRPLLFGLIGGVYGVASVAGPLMGGAFTDKLTWRWCFYINLPIGAVTALGFVLLFHVPPRAQDSEKDKHEESWLQFVKHLDPIGTTILVPCVICLLLALQWGGVTYPWRDGRVIALFVVFGVTIIAFCWLQTVLNNDATVAVRIIKQRTIASAALFGFCIGGSFFVFIYFIPIWFQAISGVSAITAGVYSLPLILAEIVAIVMSGALVTNFGYFAPFFIASSVLSAIGAGLTLLFNVDTPQASWVGFTFLYGFGVGLGFQQGGVAAQAVLPFSDVSVGTAVVLFVQILGGSVFVSVAQNIFSNRLVSNIVALGIPGLDPALIIHSGATGFRSLVDPAVLPQVLVAYNDAIVQVFQIGLILSCLSLIGALGIEWRSVKGKQIAMAAA